MKKTLSIFIVLGLIISFAGSDIVYAKQVSPKKVTNLHVSKRQSKKITLRWKGQSRVRRYQIRVLKKNNKLLKKVIVKQGLKKSSKRVEGIVKGLKPGRLYSFRVRAKVGKRFGKYSKRINARTNVRQQEDEEATPVLFGFWGLNGYWDSAGLADVNNRFGATVYQVASSAPGYTVNTLLPTVRAAGMKVTLRMTTSPDYGNDFDIDAWKTQILTWKNSGVQEFINDGTLAGHMMLDDIHNFSYISDSTNPTAAELDEMAEYSEEILPGLLNYVRQKATGMPVPDSGSYTYLDAVVNQYKASNGDVADYVAEETAKAAELNVGIINGMNIIDGGNGDSGQQGTTSNKYAMTADEITSYGEALLAVDDLEMFLMWEYDGEQEWYDGTIGSDYFDQTEIQAALSALGDTAAQ